MDSLEDKINKLYSIYGVSNDNQLSTALGYKSNSNIANWRKNNTIPAKIENIISQNMNKFNYKSIKNECSVVSEPQHTYNDIALQDMIPVNVYPDVYASAGFGNMLEESTHKKTLMDKTLLQEVFNIQNFKSLDMIKVIGDSMAPIINDGEVLFIERGAHAKNGDTVIATLNDELYVKRFRKDPFGEWVRLESENKDFPHIELNTPQKIAMLNIIGIARSKVKVY
jgi:hypothetical protein